MLEAIFQASFSNFLKGISLGLGFPWGFSYLGVFVLIPTKSKGRKEETIGRVFKKLILAKLPLTCSDKFGIIFMFCDSKFACRQRRWSDLFTRKP